MEILEWAFFDWITFGYAWNIQFMFILFIVTFIISDTGLGWLQERNYVFNDKKCELPGMAVQIAAILCLFMLFLPVTFVLTCFSFYYYFMEFTKTETMISL